MFQIDTMSRQPVYEQITEQTEQFLLRGILKPGDQIPSIRSVAMEHSINPRTILKAYSDLDHKGLIQSVPGRGYFVCEKALEILNQHSMGQLKDLTEAITAMALAGVPKDAVLQCVEQAYSEINGEETS